MKHPESNASQTVDTVLARLERQGQSTTGRAALQLVSSRLWSQLLMFSGGLVLARLLTPEAFGVAAIALTIGGFAGVITDFGIRVAVVREPRLTDAFVSSAWVLNFALSSAMAISVALAAPIVALSFDEPRLRGLLLLTALNYLCTINLVQVGLLERARRFRSVARLETLAALVGVVTSLVLAGYGFGPASLILGPVVTRLVSTLGAFLLVGWFPRPWPSTEPARRILRSSTHITGFGLLSYMGGSIDNLVLGAVAEPRSLGLYVRAYNLMRLPVGQIGVLNRVLMPDYMRYRGDRSALQDRWRRNHDYAAVLLVPVAGAFAALGEPLTVVLYGERWRDAGLLVSLLAPTIAVSVTPSTLGPMFALLDRTGLLLRLGWAQTALTVLLVCVGAFGGSTGVAAAVSVSAALGAALFCAQAGRLLGMRFLDILQELRLAVGLAVAVGACAGGARLLLGGESDVAQLAVGGLAAATCYVSAVLWRRPLFFQRVRSLLSRA